MSKQLLLLGAEGKGRNWVFARRVFGDIMFLDHALPELCNFVNTTMDWMF